MLIAREDEAYTKPGHHLNNVSQGAQASLIEKTNFPAKILEDARKLKKHQLLDIAGVDILHAKQPGDFYFLEVNSQPSLGGVYAKEKAALLGRLLAQSLDKSGHK